MPRKTTYGTLDLSHNPDNVFRRTQHLSGDRFEVSDRLVVDILFAYTGHKTGDVTQAMIKQIQGDLCERGVTEMSIHLERTTYGPRITIICREPENFIPMYETGEAKAYKEYEYSQLNALLSLIHEKCTQREAANKSDRPDLTF